MGEGQTANADQIKAWDGPEGDIWTDNETFYTTAVRALTPHLFAAAAIGPGDRVLDIGCGTGETTRIAARAGKEAVGVDLSSRMLERARQRAAEEGLGNVRFEKADVQVHPFEPASFDVAISRHGSMFFDHPIAAFSNVRRALTPGGRLALLVWRGLEDNAWMRRIVGAVMGTTDLPSPPPDVPGPFSLADPQRVTAILEAAGFEDVSLEPLDEPLFFGSDAAEAFDAFTRLGPVQGARRQLDEAGERALLDRLTSLAREEETPDGVQMGSGAWIVRARARRGEEGS